MFQEELAISDLWETYHRKSKELAFLRIAGNLSVHLQLPTFCLLAQICIISCHLLLFNIVISWMSPQFSDTLLMKFLFFLNCPFIMSPPHKVIKKSCLLPGITEHMWTTLTCTVCNKNSSFLSDRNSRARGHSSPREHWGGSGQSTEGALGCCRCRNSLVIWILLLNNLGIVNVWV